MSYDPFDVAVFPTCEPNYLVSGQHSGWKIDLDFDDTLYSVKYVMRKYEVVDDSDATNDPDQTLTINGTYDANEEAWVFEYSDTIDSGDEGSYAWDLIVVRTSDSAEKTLSSGFMKLFLGTDDRRSHAEIMIAKIDSVLQGRADSDISNYSIKGRSIDKMSPKELTEWRDYYRYEILETGGSVVTGDHVSSVRKNTVRVRFA